MTAALQEKVATDERGLEGPSGAGPDRLLAPASQHMMSLELVHTGTNPASAAILDRDRA